MEKSFVSHRSDYEFKETGQKHPAEMVRIARRCRIYCDGFSWIETLSASSSRIRSKPPFSSSSAPIGASVASRGRGCKQSRPRWIERQPAGDARWQQCEPPGRN